MWLAFCVYYFLKLAFLVSDPKLDQSDCPVFSNPWSLAFRLCFFPPMVRQQEHRSVWLSAGRRSCLPSLRDTCASLASACLWSEQKAEGLLALPGLSSEPSITPSMCLGTGTALGKPSSGQPHQRAPRVLPSPIGRRNGKESSCMELMLGEKAYPFLPHTPCSGI